MERLHAKPNTNYKELPEPDITAIYHLIKINKERRSIVSLFLSCNTIFKK